MIVELEVGVNLFDSIAPNPEKRVCCSGCFSSFFSIFSYTFSVTFSFLSVRLLLSEIKLTLVVSMLLIKLIFLFSLFLLSLKAEKKLEVAFSSILFPKKPLVLSLGIVVNVGVIVGVGVVIGVISIEY